MLLFEVEFAFCKDINNCKLTRKECPDPTPEIVKLSPAFVI